MAIIVHKKAFAKGVVLAVLFFAVLAFLFSPSFDGGNAFHYSDKLFNSISKGSTNYFPKLREMAKPFEQKEVDLVLRLKDEAMKKDAATILSSAGAKVTSTGEGLSVQGNFGDIVEASIADGELLFFNKGEDVRTKYSIEERRAVYTWWKVLKESIKSLNNQKLFKEAALVEEVINRGVEVGYNFYKIEPESAQSKAGILVFALIFYVVYTLWWGFAVFFITEGFGLELTGGHKEET